jgi:hypothetical protein
MRVGLFIPCFIDAFFPEVGIATLAPSSCWSGSATISTRSSRPPQ